MVITTTASKITQRARKKRGFSCKNLQKCNAVEEVDTKNRTNVVFFLKKKTMRRPLSARQVNTPESPPKRQRVSVCR